MRRFLLQMAGEPGSGKSALARGVGRATGAVVIDKDVIKSAALRAGAEEALAAPLAYQVFFDLARSLLAMGHSVVLDSPAFYPLIREQGQQIAAEAGVEYHIFECVCVDPEELARRLAGRERLVSQPAGRDRDPYSQPGTAPLMEAHLTVDTRQPLCDCLPQALAYIGHDTR